MPKRHIEECPHKIGFQTAVREVIPTACTECPSPEVHYFNHPTGVALCLVCYKWDTCEKRKEEVTDGR